MIDKWKQSLDNNKNVISIFIDLTKAFDTVDHKILLHKLSYYNFSHNSIALINNYLSNRFSIANFNNHFSKKEPISIGVPQGSVLGPLLFIIFINDLSYLDTKSDMTLFADDTTIYFSDESIDFISTTLTNDMKLICEWLKFNRLIINWSKTHALLFNYRKKTPINYSTLNLSIDNTLVPFVSNTKILGVIVDNKLKFDLHISAVCKKVNSKVAVINRRAYLFSKPFLTTLFKLFIQSHFDYCSTLFTFTTNKSDLNFLHSTFNKSIKKLFKINIRNLDSTAQYNILKNNLHNILPLSFRLFYRFCLFTFSLFQNPHKYIITNNITKQKNNLRSCYNIPLFNTLYYKFSFSVLAVKLLRSFILSHLSESKSSFKSFLLNNISSLFSSNIKHWT